MSKTNERIIIVGVISILTSLLFLFSEIPTYFEQRANKDILWHYWITAELHAGAWVIATILLISGILFIFKNKYSQLTYNLFGISIISECIVRIINYDKGLFLGYLSIIPIGFGIFAMFISNSERWKKELNLNTRIGIRIWIVNIILVILICGIPRLIFKGHHLL